MYNNCSQHLIDPLLTLLQWLSVEIVSTSIASVEFIWVFLYAIKATVTSKLIILVRFGNNTNPKIPNSKLIILVRFGNNTTLKFLKQVFYPFLQQI